MNTLNNQWPNRYVAHFDILGMRYLQCNNKMRAIEILYDFDDIIKSEISKSITFIENNEFFIISDQIEIFSFSDSIVMFTKENTIRDLWAIIVLGNQIFSQCLHKCIAIRGGISYGDFLYDSKRKIFCGCPLVEAYDIGEEAQWLGVVVSENVAKKCHENKISTRGKPGVVEWDVPLKKRRIFFKKRVRRDVINWPSVFQDNFTVPMPIYIEQLYSAFEKDFGKYAKLHKDIKKKYANTVDFINNMLTR